MPITQTYRILCNNTKSINKHQVIMTSITDKEEAIIDELQNNSIKLKRGDITFNVYRKHIYCYGEVDFNSEDDLNTIEDFNFLSHLDGRGISIPSDYNYDTHECNPRTKGIKWSETFSPAVLAKYNHACLGKPKRICLFINLIK